MLSSNIDTSIMLFAIYLDGTMSISELFWNFFAFLYTKIGTPSVHVGSCSEVSQDTPNYNNYQKYGTFCIRAIISGYSVDN